ncbi:MAG TPA: phosphodiester glycosidase family protein, partial [Leptospiraceae bacterium]|nr:phosphodiester glycosidase family protein [Leptospiraceae bacterium]
MKNYFKNFLFLLLIILGLLFLSLSGFYFWLNHRSQPEAKTEEIFKGVTYIRDVRKIPRPLVLHILKIDLRNKNLAFLVTPPDYSGEFVLKAQSTSEFLVKNKLDIAINGDFFLPWYYNSLTDYYPHRKDPVNPNGIAISKGISYVKKTVSKFSTLFIDHQNQFSFDSKPDLKTISNAISSKPMILREGKIEKETLEKEDHFYSRIHPRTAIALDKERKTLIILVADGRQPDYSMGLTGLEIIYILTEHGATDIMNLDGGGSSTLVISNGENN